MARTNAVGAALVAAQGRDASGVAPVDVRILEATLELVSAHGATRTSVDDIATRSGVSRMTVFRRFGTKEKLVEAALERELHRLIEDLTDRAGGRTSVQDCATEAFDWMLEVGWTHPYITRLATQNVDALVAFWRDHEPSWQAISTEVIASLLSNPGLDTPLDRGGALHAADLMVRLAISYIIAPPTTEARDAASRHDLAMRTIDALACLQR